MRCIPIGLLATLLLFVTTSCTTPRTGQPFYEREAVVCESLPAARAGAELLEAGGNAMDAAVGTAFALAVTFPQAGNIGGGGFLVSHFPDDPGGPERAFDFRERAPARAHPEMFLDESGEYSPRLHHHSHLAVGVPGSVSGLHAAHRELGRLPWERVLEPAIRLAREGFVVDERLEASLARVYSQIRPVEARDAIFQVDGRPLKAGDRWRQPDLAASLERIAREGPEGFYRGPTADLLVEEMERGGGLIDHEDLRAYRTVEREPVRGTYRGLEVVSMPPVSSGGIALLQMLQMLEPFDLGAPSPAEDTIELRTRRWHLLAEAMRRAFADRARHLGDPDHVEVPVDELLDPDYAARQARSIHLDRASESRPDRFSWPPVSGETTHLSVIDRDGNGVSLTTTLEHSWGARIVVPGAGFLLNNEMGDFNPAPGLTDENGRIGTPPNLAAGGKRMVSSMTPTIVLRDGRLDTVLGSPGGRTIINSVLEVIVALVDRGLPLQAAVDAPRIHHQWLPDRIVVEPTISPDVRQGLRDLGHEVQLRNGFQGSVMALRRDPLTGRIETGQDRRRGGASAGR